MSLKFKEKLSLKVQYLLGWITFPVWGSFLIGLLRFVGRYKIQHIREVRKHFKQLKNSVEGTLLVCSNHLTLIDSLI